MSRPIDLGEAVGRGLIASGDTRGVYTFPNGSSWDEWATTNCYRCQWYDDDGTAGDHCAFEAAAFLGIVTPELARMFGWTARGASESSFAQPEQCPHFRLRDEKKDDDDAPPRAPKPDPNQLVLLADPTEDAALLVAPKPRKQKTPPASRADGATPRPAARSR